MVTPICEVSNKDDLLTGGELELAQIKYHLSCYKWYTKKSKRIKDLSSDDDIDEVTDGNTDEQTASLALSQTKRWKKYRFVVSFVIKRNTWVT